MSEGPSPSTVDYAEAAAGMRRAGLGQSPAEAHGFATGLLLAEIEDPAAAWAQEWYAELDPADVLAGECRAVLDRILAQGLDAPAAGPLQLSLLLPDGVAVDRGRLDALRDWCQGFLFGFGLGGEAVAARLSAQARELLRDLAEVTRLDTEDVENNAENQAALIEIEEYVREGVMLIRDELVQGRDKDEQG
jgi:uncharacterized protein YgfB (UPF0149 family)